VATFEVAESGDMQYAVHVHVPIHIISYQTSQIYALQIVTVSLIASYALSKDGPFSKVATICPLCSQR
jgi:hypothetical protein